MTEKISIARRKLIAFMGWFSIFARQASAVQGPPVAPCSFPFDASRKDSVLEEKFSIDKHRNYIFTLEFYHDGGDGAKKLSALLDADYALFTVSSNNSSSPTLVIADDFLEKKTFSSVQEKGRALTEATVKYDQARRSAIWAKDENKKYAWRPRNLSGLIPITIEIVKLEPSGVRSVLSHESVDTLGTFRGGNGHFDRQITVEDLRPGTYEVRAETVRDSPLFFGTQIRLGITYHPNTTILND